MRVIIQFKNAEYAQIEFDTIDKKGLKVSRNSNFKSIVILDVKFVEYYMNSIKLTTSDYKMYEFETADVEYFEVTKEQ